MECSCELCTAVHCLHVEHVIIPDAEAVGLSITDTDLCETAYGKQT